MPYPIEKKFVIAVSSSALFNLTIPDSIYRARGVDEYRIFMEKTVNEPFEKGVAFPFVRRLLSLNSSFPEERPIEVVLFSKNSPETGLRAFNSIRYYNLDITRACFSAGQQNFEYLPAFNASLFLTANENDAKKAIESNYAAGMVLNSAIVDDEEDKELRLAFDFDGVIADDESEKFYQQEGIDNYMAHEAKLAGSPLAKGPVSNLLQKISFFQKMEKRKERVDKDYKHILSTSIVTARNAPAHERVVSTLKDMNVEVDSVFFLGGIDKANVLKVLKPHIFFDDQMVHLDHLGSIPAVHVPFGIKNRKSDGQ